MCLFLHQKWYFKEGNIRIYVEWSVKYLNDLEQQNTSAWYTE